MRRGSMVCAETYGRGIRNTMLLFKRGMDAYLAFLVTSIRRECDRGRREEEEGRGRRRRRREVEGMT